MLSGAGAAGAHHEVPFPEADAPDAYGAAAHGAHVPLIEAGGHAVVGGDDDILVAGGGNDGNQLVPFLQGQGPDAVGADVLQCRLLHPLDGALAGDEDQIAVLLHTPAPDHGADLLGAVAGFNLDEVDDIGAPGVSARLGDGIALLDEHPALAGEEEDIVMGGGGEHGLHIVLLLGGHGPDALAATALRAVLADGQALDVAAVGQGKDALLLLDEVFHVDLVGHVLDLGIALVAVFIPQGSQLVLQHAPDQCRVGQQALEVTDLFLQLLILLLQLFPVQALEGDQAHIADGLGLHLAEGEALHQVLLGIVIAGTDDMDNLVNIILGDQQALQQMGPLLRLAQVIAGAADDQVLLEAEVLVQNMPQGQDAGLGLVIHQGQHIDGEAGLQGSLGKEPVQHHLGVGVPLQFDNDAHTVAVRLIPQVGDTLQPLVMDLVGYVLNELPLVHLIGKLGDDDAGAVLAVLLKLGAGADDHLAPAGGIGLADAAAAHDDAPGGKVRPGDVLHQVVQSGLRVIQHADAGVDDLRQVMGRDVGGHAHGNAAAAVDQQVGETGGQDPGFLPGFVKVGVPVHGILLNIPQHFVGDFGKPGLGITVGGRRVAVHGAEVAVAVHQHIAHGEVLSQAHHGVVNGGVAMGMVAAQHVAHAGGGLLEGLIRGQIVLIQSVEDATVNGLQAVPHVGQGPAHDDAHGVVDVAGLHFVDQLRFGDHLIGKGNVLRLVVSLVCHLPSPP